MGTLGEDAEDGDGVKGEGEGAHLGEELERMVGGGDANEGSVVDGVFVGVGDLVEEVQSVGVGVGGEGVEVEEGVEEEVRVVGGEEAGDEGGGVELGGGAEGGGAGAAAEEGAEEEAEGGWGVWGVVGVGDCPSHTIITYVSVVNGGFDDVLRCSAESESRCCGKLG